MPPRCRRRPSASSSLSGISDDILLNIFGGLRTLRDFFAARAVCRDWRRVANSHSPKILQVVTRDRVGALYDIVSRRFYDLPCIHPSRRIIGYSRGHLITLPPFYSSSRGTVDLWNLFTGAKTELPQIHYNSGRFILSARPDSPHCQVIMLEITSNKLRHLSVGDAGWITVFSYRMKPVRDMMFFRGKWLALTKDMELLAVELRGYLLTVRELGGVGAVVRGREFLNMWLGEFDGVMFAVCRVAVTGGYDVFRWDSEKNGWEEIRDVGDLALFVSSRGGLVLISATRLGLRKNCVYLTNGTSGSWEEFSLDDRSRIEVPGFVPLSLVPHHFWVLTK